MRIRRRRTGGPRDPLAEIAHTREVSAVFPRGEEILDRAALAALLEEVVARVGR